MVHAEFLEGSLSKGMFRRAALLVTLHMWGKDGWKSCTTQAVDFRRLLIQVGLGLIINPLTVAHHSLRGVVSPAQSWRKATHRRPLFQGFLCATRSSQDLELRTVIVPN